MTKIIFAILSLVFSAQAWAFVSPLGLAIVKPLEFPPDDFNVAGVRASVLWGQHRNVYGLDLGLIGNITEQDFVGVALSGGFNMTHGDTLAVIGQIAGVANYNSNKTRVIGVQGALVTNINRGESMVAGLQLALANHAPFTNIWGLQAGLYNRALEVRGLQIGVVNICENLHGLQLGLINFNHKGTFAVSPFLNIGF